MADFSYSSPEVTFVLGLVETYLRSREANEEDRGYEIYHPSAFGSCLRLMQYQRYEARGLVEGKAEQFGGRMLRLFENGHVMHDRWKNYFEHLGVLRGVWACKNPLCRLFNDEGNVQKELVGVNGTLLESQLVAEAKKYLDNPKEYRPRSYGHDKLQGCFKPEKCACGCQKFHYNEVAVISEELNFRGHADILLDFSNFDPNHFSEDEKNGLSVFFKSNALPKGIIVIDMKTIGTNSFRQTVLKSGYQKKHGVQLSIYINILQCDYGILIYEEKDQFELAAFKIEKSAEVWDEIKRQAKTMNDYAADPKPKLPPPRPISKSSYECKSCGFSKQCHRDGGIWDDPELDSKRRAFYGELL